jgi:hypothetical protein
VFQSGRVHPSIWILVVGLAPDWFQAYHEKSKTQPLGSVMLTGLVPGLATSTVQPDPTRVNEMVELGTALAEPNSEEMLTLAPVPEPTFRTRITLVSKFLSRLTHIVRSAGRVSRDVPLK